MEFEKWLYLTLIAACVAHIIGWAALFAYLSVKERRDRKARNRQVAEAFRKAEAATRETDACIMALIDRRVRRNEA